MDEQSTLDKTEDRITPLNELEFYTLEEVAKILNISQTTVRRYIRQEENPLPVIKMSAQEYRVSKEDLLNWSKSLKDPRQDI